MGEILVKEKEIVAPGDVLASGMDYIPTDGAFRDGENIVSSLLGLVYIKGRLIKVLPLNGVYIPKKDDVVIGRVSDMTYSSWFVDVGYAYDAVLSLKDASSDYIERGADLTTYFNIDDFIIAKVLKVNKSMAIDLTMKGPGLRKITRGTVITITPQKVPRVVGKMGSMVSLIKENTGCQIVAGQNGRIWINGTVPDMERLAVKAIKFIEQNAHKSGLTEMVKTMLSKEAKK
ncbi:S1 RNA-binding domain-containing protein [Candidatus Woesearchaeota archaeon]|nr:MAG: S1 RNA-binding domain-containing protein [Candidatus Woesearchaeota archaeon]